MIASAAVEAAGLEEAARALDDERWDDPVRESHALAYASAGPDIGSPVLLVPGAPAARANSRKKWLFGEPWALLP